MRDIFSILYSSSQERKFPLFHVPKDLAAMLGLAMLPPQSQLSTSSIPDY